MGGVVNLSSIKPKSGKFIRCYSSVCTEKRRIVIASAHLLGLLFEVFLKRILASYVAL